jgi:hypothetical protein
LKVQTFGNFCIDHGPAGRRDDEDVDRDYAALVLPSPICMYPWMRDGDESRHGLHEQ